MKTVLFLSLLVAGCLAAPAPHKRFLVDSFSGIVNGLLDGFKTVISGAQDTFNSLTDGLQVDFHQIVGKLTSLLTPGETESSCQHTCINAGASLLGSAASLGAKVCVPLCTAALADAKFSVGPDTTLEPL